MDPLKFLTDAPIWKGLLAVVAMASAYVLPTVVEQNLAVGCFVLVFMDMLSAIAAVTATEGKEAIQSAKLRRTVVKLSIYSIGVITVAIASKIVALPEPYASMGAAGLMTYVVVTEVKSIFENLSKAGWNPLERSKK